MFVVPRLNEGEKKMTYRAQVLLPDEWAAELERQAEENGTRPTVLARMALIQWLREHKQAVASQDTGVDND